MIIGIETSFDDTCAAIVRADGSVLSNEKESFGKYMSEHAPIKSAQYHQQNLPKVLQSALDKAQVTSLSDIKAVAVTIGPG